VFDIDDRIVVDHGVFVSSVRYRQIYVAVYGIWKAVVFINSVFVFFMRYCNISSRLCFDLLSRIIVKCLRYGIALVIYYIVQINKYL